MPFNRINDQEREAIEKSFTYHKPKDDQPERYEALRDAAKQMAIAIHKCCPHSRERSIAITNLETAVMWGNKAIAHE